MLSRRNELNPNYKGEKAGYKAKHLWINNYFGHPRVCEICKVYNLKMYHWANVSGKYLRDRDDWKRLCVPCHRKFDNAIGENHWKSKLTNKQTRVIKWASLFGVSNEYLANFFNVSPSTISLIRNNKIRRNHI